MPPDKPFNREHLTWGCPNCTDPAGWPEYPTALTFYCGKEKAQDRKTGEYIDGYAVSVTGRSRFCELASGWKETKKEAMVAHLRFMADFLDSQNESFLK